MSPLIISREQRAKPNAGQHPLYGHFLVSLQISPLCKHAGIRVIGLPMLHKWLDFGYRIKVEEKKKSLTKTTTGKKNKRIKVRLLFWSWTRCLAAEQGKKIKKDSDARQTAAELMNSNGWRFKMFVLRWFGKLDYHFFFSFGIDVMANDACWSELWSSGWPRVHVGSINTLKPVCISLAKHWGLGLRCHYACRNSQWGFEVAFVVMNSIQCTHRRQTALRLVSVSLQLIISFHL